MSATKAPAAPRVLQVEFDLPPTVNKLERMHHRKTSELRRVCEARWRAEKPRGFGDPMRRFVVRATFFEPGRGSDPLELNYRIKRHIDAAKLAGLIVDDGPRHLIPTVPLQVMHAERPRVVITLEEVLRE